MAASSNADRVQDERSSKRARRRRDEGPAARSVSCNAVPPDTPAPAGDPVAVPDRIPPTMRFLLGANLVSNVGSGLTLPFLLIYLHDVRHIPLAITGALIGSAAVVGIAVGPAAGALVDRFGARSICAAAFSVSAAGALGLIAVRNVASAIPVLLVMGFGESSVWPTWNALFAAMIPEEGLRPRVFARSFQLMNLGLGLGAVVAGVVVHVTRPDTFTLIYLVDGATYLVLVAVILLLRARTRIPGARHSAEDRTAAGGFRTVLADRRFRRYLLASSILAFAGYSATDAGFVGYANHVVGAGSDVIAWAFGLNTAMIVVLQPVGLKVAARLRRTSSLMMCAALFGLSWIVLLVGGSFAGSDVGYSLVVATFGVFSLGEILLAPVGFPLVTMLAPAALQGRYNATATSVYTTTSVVNPAVAGVMLGAGLGRAYLGLLVVFSGGAVAAFWRLRRALSAAVDNAPGEPRAGSGLAPAAEPRA